MGSRGGGTRVTATRGGMVAQVKNAANLGTERLEGRVQNLQLTNGDGTPVSTAQRSSLFDRNGNLQQEPYRRLDDRSKLKVLRTAVMAQPDTYPRGLRRGDVAQVMDKLGFTGTQRSAMNLIGQSEGRARAYMNRAKATRDPVAKRMNIHLALREKQAVRNDARRMPMSKNDIQQARDRGIRIPQGVE